jgi:monofunctional biosynthetic peptidoglycan transglycosylase
MSGMRRWSALVAAGLAAAGAWWYVTLPDGAEFVRQNPVRTALMRDRETRNIHNRPIPQHIPQHILWAPMAEIAPALRHAVIVAEDANFYRHHGIDWEALRLALKRNWKERRLYRGGSTITQQLAKNLYLDPEKTVWRKITEGLIAMRMERQLSKTRILELYLNVAEWGRGVYGAGAAARHHFGKPAAELTIGEASWLAAILPAPLRYEHQPGAPAVTARAATIRRLVERRLAGSESPPATIELPPLPLDESPDEAPPEETPPEDTPIDPTGDTLPQIGKNPPI